jgi:hypothetical protein
MQGDAQPVPPDRNLVHPLDGLARHRHTVDFCSERTPAILDPAALSIEVQDGMTGRHVDILQANHRAGIAADGHLGRGEHQRTDKARVLEEDDLERAAGLGGPFCHFFSWPGEMISTVRSRKLSGTFTMLLNSLGERWKR